MRAVLKSLELEPDPSTLSGDPAEFSLLARMIVGPPDTPGEESFDVTVCSPEWLAGKARAGFYDARHHVVVDFETFDRNARQAWLTKRVDVVQADTWGGIGELLGRLGYWEFEDYRP
ncbi:Imm8 family immunity protein [Mumia sp. ZJ430]|uniref:Imm8 family immunity protein n=1 Tax=Mumia sp. ZJ430 TaxID=2708083 RepID=UPI0014243662|nr:Imm8 family immunity protein [Mumia sp. ZJ430]